MKLNAAFRSWNRICNAFRLNDQIPIYMNSNVFTNKSATSVIVFTSARQNVTSLSTNMKI